MKKVFILIAALSLTSTVFAQESKTRRIELKPQSKNQTHCYAMLDNAMVHCIGLSNEPMNNDAKLKDGTTISLKGEVNDGGRTLMLANDQCIDENGKISKYEKVHKALRKEHEKKEEMNLRRN